MKKIAFIFFCLFAMGCGQINRSCAKWTGHSFECVRGIEYIQFPSGASVPWNKDGTIRTCDDSQ